MDSGAAVDLDFYDSSGKLLDSSYGCSNGDGVTVKDLVAGQTYEVVVSYGNMATPYVVSVGMQKRALDISSATEASDSIDYTDQRNLYNFTPSKNGDYRFEIAGLSSGSTSWLNILNSLAPAILPDSTISMENVA